MAQQYPAYAQQTKPYPYQPQQEIRPKELPIALVIAAGIVAVVFILGGAIGYVSVAPCTFLKSVLGEDNVAKLQDQNNLKTPCQFAENSFSCSTSFCKGRDVPCTVWKLDNNEGCRQFIIEATTK